MATLPEDLSRFPTLASLKPPRVMRAAGALVAITIVTVIVFALTVPWVQTAAGTGTVIALDPLDRQPVRQEQADRCQRAESDEVGYFSDPELEVQP